jgi:hypothetical protein
VQKFATPIAVPRILKGKTSGNIIQTVSPHVAAEEMIKLARQTNVMMAKASEGFDGWGSNSEKSPKTLRLSTIPTSLIRSSGLRPSRSTKRIATRVISTLMRLMTAWPQMACRSV